MAIYKWSDAMVSIWDMSAVYKWEDLVRWWKPWANTLAYFLFKDNQNDSSWNWATLSTTWTKQAIGYSFYTWSNSRVTISMNNVENIKWFCCWQKLDSASWTSWLNTFYDRTSMWWNLYDYGTTTTIWTFYTSSYAKASTPITVDWNWHLMWVWFDGTNTVYWFDNTFWILRAWAWYNFWNTFALQATNSWTSWTVTHSNFIAESKCRDSEEWTKYYNQTKWNYWL